MELLNKEERNGFYYLALAEAEENIKILKNEKLPTNRPYGLCAVAAHLTHNNFDLRNFSELMKQKPKNADLYWFPVTRRGWNKRKKLIINAIKETENG